MPDGMKLYVLTSVAGVSPRGVRAAKHAEVLTHPAAVALQARVTELEGLYLALGPLLEHCGDAFYCDCDEHSERTEVSDDAIEAFDAYKAKYGPNPPKGAQ